MNILKRRAVVKFIFEQPVVYIIFVNGPAASSGSRFEDLLAIKPSPSLDVVSLLLISVIQNLDRSVTVLEPLILIINT